MHRTENMAPSPAIDFTALLADVPRGAWVAISSDTERLLAYGSDMKKVLEEAKHGGEQNPIIMRVPECASSLFL
jgi:hypothetical protein